MMLAPFRRSASALKKWWLGIFRSKRPGIIFHDPDATEPHDLDDPLFDRKVQQRFGEIIAKANERK